MELPVHPCVAPTGQDHEAFEEAYRSHTALPLPPSESTARTIWFIERCQQLETDKLHLVQEIRKREEDVSRQKRATAALRKANSDLKDLVAEMAESLRAAHKEKEAQQRVVDNHVEEAAALKRKIKDLNHDRRHLQQKTKNMVSLQVQLDEARSADLKRSSEFEARFQAAVDEECRSIKRDMEATRRRMAEIEARAAEEAALLDSVPSLRAQLEEAHASIADLQSKRAEDAEAAAQQEAAHVRDIEARQARIVETEQWANGRVATVVALEDQLREAQARLASVDTERVELQRGLYKQQVRADQAEGLLQDTRKRLQTASQVVLEAKKLTRMEYLAGKDFKKKMSELLKGAIASGSDGGAGAPSPPTRRPASRGGGAKGKARRTKP